MRRWRLSHNHDFFTRKERRWNVTKYQDCHAKRHYNIIWNRHQRFCNTTIKQNSQDVLYCCCRWTTSRLPVALSLCNVLVAVQVLLSVFRFLYVICVRVRWLVLFPSGADFDLSKERVEYQKRSRIDPQLLLTGGATYKGCHARKCYREWNAWGLCNQSALQGALEKWRVTCLRCQDCDTRCAPECPTRVSHKTVSWGFEPTCCTWVATFFLAFHRATESFPAALFDHERFWSMCPRFLMSFKFVRTIVWFP
jgi:hypothetical protein